MSNIRVSDDGRVWLLDLELAHQIGDNSTPFGLGTPGFMSPSQEARQPPKGADDVYSLGCVFLFALTGIDPRRVLFADETLRPRQLLELSGRAPPELVSLIVQCLHSDSAARPTIAVVKAELAKLVITVEQSDSRGDSGFSWGGFRPQLLSEGDLLELVARGERGLFEATLVDASAGLWLSKVADQTSAAARAGSFELRRDAHQGVAGVLYLLGRLSRVRLVSRQSKEASERVADWLIRSHKGTEPQLPGLYFGDAGVAVAIAEAISGGLIEHGGEQETFIRQSLEGCFDWPDVTHGAAGQGLAAIICADRLGGPPADDFLHACASYLVNSQKADGSWEMPEGVEGMSGQTLTGFAHGVAGVVYFLCEYAHRFQDVTVDAGWRAGAEWLVRRAVRGERHDSLEWAYSDVHETRWRWWCHGSPGIALTFLRLYERTRDASFADVAARGLRVLPRKVRSGNLSQCHGLSGLGEIFLEASRVLGDDEWYERAASVAATIATLRRTTDSGSVTWLVEDPHVATADLMVGSSGVLHFLLRMATFQDRGRLLGPPLLLGPAPGSVVYEDHRFIE